MKDNIKFIFLCLLLVFFVCFVLIAVIFLENEAKKTQLGLTVLYFFGVLIFLRNVYAFYKKKVMKFRSLVFYHPQDKENRVFLLCVSVIAVGGFGFAFFDSLLRLL